MRRSTAERLVLKTGEVVDLNEPYIGHMVGRSIIVGYVVDTEGFATLRQRAIDYDDVEEHTTLSYGDELTLVPDPSCLPRSLDGHV